MYRMSRAEKILFVILLWCGQLLAGCTAGSRTLTSNSRTSEADNSSANTRPIVVHILDVQPSPGSTGGDLLIPASLSVEDTAVVLAERDGRIINLRGQEGARVTKGDVLALKTDLVELKADLTRLTLTTMIAMTAIFAAMSAALRFVR